MYYGYHRTSTTEQHLDRGVLGIKLFCKEHNYPLEKIFTDKISGRTFDRPRYLVMKEDVLRDFEDTLIIYELDRLGRNKADIAKELAYYKERGIRLMFLDIPTTTIDLSGMEDNISRLIIDTVNNILIELISVNAEAEVERKRKRCTEGIEAMKTRGDWYKYGRPRKMDKDIFAVQYSRVVRGEIGSLALMNKLGLKKDTYFRYVREYRSNNDVQKENT